MNKRQLKGKRSIGLCEMALNVLPTYLVNLVMGGGFGGRLFMSTITVALMRTAAYSYGILAQILIPLTVIVLVISQIAISIVQILQGRICRLIKRNTI